MFKVELATNTYEYYLCTYVDDTSNHLLENSQATPDDLAMFTTQFNAISDVHT